jgi:4-hydroxymandelate oxidase
MDRWNGVIVSNHGGLVETGRGTIDILPEVVDAVGGRIPVLVDGGIRRGSDVYKALAIATRAVGIGRPYIYGLASFGQEGAERVLDILRHGTDSHDQPCAWMAASSCS